MVNSLFDKSFESLICTRKQTTLRWETNKRLTKCSLTLEWRTDGKTSQSKLSKPHDVPNLGSAACDCLSWKGSETTCYKKITDIWTSIESWLWFCGPRWQRGFWAMRPGTTQCIDMKTHPRPSLTSLSVIWPATSQENKRPFLSHTSTLPLLPQLTSSESRTRVLCVPYHILPHHSPNFFGGQIFREWSISVSLVYHPVT